MGFKKLLWQHLIEEDIKSRSNNANNSDKSQTAEVFESLDSTANKSEQWILKNQNKIFIVIAAISISVLSYLGYERLIVEPKEKEAISELNTAQYFFEMALFPMNQIHYLILH